MRDFSNNMKVAVALAPALRTASATGGAIDRLGFEQVTFIVTAGAYTNGTHTLVFEASDDNSTWAAVAASELVGEAPVIDTSGEQNTAYPVGYIGDARYVRVKSNVTGSPATGAIVGANVLLTKPALAPVA